MNLANVNIKWKIMGILERRMKMKENEIDGNKMILNEEARILCNTYIQRVHELSKRAREREREL